MRDLTLPHVIHACQNTACVTRGDVIPTLKPSTASFAGLGRHSRSRIVWDQGPIWPPAHSPSPPPGRLWARVRDTTSRGGQVAPLTHPPELTFAWPEASPREQNTEPHVGPEWGCRAPKNNRWGEGNPELGGSHWREMSTEGKGSDAPADVYKIRKQVWRTTVKKA